MLIRETEESVPLPPPSAIILARRKRGTLVRVESWKWNSLVARERGKGAPSDKAGVPLYSIGCPGEKAGSPTCWLVNYAAGSPLKTAEPWYFRARDACPRRTVPRAPYTIRIMQNRRAERIACCESLTSPCPCPGHLSARNAYILGLIAVPCAPRPFLSPRPLRFTGKMRVPRADGNRSVNFAPPRPVLYVYKL